MENFQVRAEDPFAKTITGQSTASISSISQQNILRAIQNNSNSKMNSLATPDFLNNFGSISNEAMKMDSSTYRTSDIDTVDKTISTISSSSKPEQETIISKTINETTIPMEIQKTPQQIEVTTPEKQSKSNVSYTTASLKVLLLKLTFFIAKTSS